MESPVRIRVLEQAVLVLVVHPHLLIFLFLRAHEVVGVDEVVAGVVGRVDVDHLHLAQIRLLQQLGLSRLSPRCRGFRWCPIVLLSSGQGRSVLRMGLFASTMEAFFPTHVNS